MEAPSSITLYGPLRSPSVAPGHGVSRNTPEMSLRAWLLCVGPQCFVRHAGRSDPTEVQAQHQD